MQVYVFVIATIMWKVLLTVVCLGAWPPPAPAQVLVIAHKSVPAESIDRGMLLDFYTGDIRSWPNGQPVVVIDLAPRTDVKETFYRYLGKTSSRMRSIWLKRKLSGEGDPPESLETEEEMVKRVGSTPGAVGFVSRDKINNRVKVLAVIPVQ